LRNLFRTFDVGDINTKTYSAYVGGFPLAPCDTRQSPYNLLGSKHGLQITGSHIDKVEMIHSVDSIRFIGTGWPGFHEAGVEVSHDRIEP